MPDLASLPPLKSFLTRVQYSVHSPTEFIQTHSHQLLPTWSSAIASVLVVLQQCQVPLFDRTFVTEQQKYRLRLQFFDFGHRVATHLQQMGYAADLFDPKTGLPLLSPPGSLPLNDVAVVRAALGYSTSNIGGCLLLLHPVWDAAVYPSVLVSSAPPSVLTAVADEIANRTSVMS